MVRVVKALLLGNSALPPSPTEGRGLSSFNEDRESGVNLQLFYNVQMDAAVLGDRLPAGGPRKAFPRPRQPLFAVPALRELESACRVSISQ